MKHILTVSIAVSVVVTPSYAMNSSRHPSLQQRQRAP
jgi:hypothetical protein